MAIINARTGQKVSFSGSDTVKCVLQAPNRQGVQIIADGFNIEDADVLIELPGGVVQTPTALEEPGQKTCIVGRHFSMKGISLNGLSAGTYAVTFIQL